MNKSDIFLFIHFKGTSRSQGCAVSLTKQCLCNVSTEMSSFIIQLHEFRVGKLWFFSNI